MNRREFLKQASTLSAAVAATQITGEVVMAGHTQAAMPMIQLGKLKVSRIFLGSNPFFGYSHGNPQATADEMRQWYTPQRIKAVLDEAANLGINAVWTPIRDEWIRTWNDYKENGGKLKNWIAQPDRLPMEKDIETAIKNGSTAVCIQGIKVDDQVKKGNWDVVQGWLELIRSHGLPAGIATHRATTHLEAEEKNMPTDFYHQTMYRPDNYVKEGLEESLATVEKLDKPVVAYKALGAGRITPAKTLPYIFSKLKRKDGVCVGVFPKKNPNEIRENAHLVIQCTKTG